jgi:hypothetical protein
MFLEFFWHSLLSYWKYYASLTALVVGWALWERSCACFIAVPIYMVPFACMALFEALCWKKQLARLIPEVDSFFSSKSGKKIATQTVWAIHHTEDEHGNEMFPRIVLEKALDHLSSNGVICPVEQERSRPAGFMLVDDDLECISTRLLP